MNDGISRRYQKRPIIIEAFQLTREQCDTLSVPTWAQPLLYQWQDALIIDTLEGGMRAEPGDYIIRGIKGEVYPCKPDIFAATYDLVDEAHS